MGRLLAHWLQRSGEGKFAYDVRVAESRDAGATWTESVVPHAQGVPAEHGFVSILPAADGGAAILMLDGTAGALAAEAAKQGAAVMTRTAAGCNSGTPRGRTGRVIEQRILDTRTCDCCQTTRGDDLARTGGGVPRPER
jgi:hypothetical protein